jgi:hypothetical protein
MIEQSPTQRTTIPQRIGSLNAGVLSKGERINDGKITMIDAEVHKRMKVFEDHLWQVQEIFNAQSDATGTELSRF